MDLISNGQSIQKVNAGNARIVRVYAGGQLVWMPFMKQSTTVFTRSTAGTYVHTLPEWTGYFDVICLGGGSGGNGGDGALGGYGRGGLAGGWGLQRYRLTAPNHDSRLTVTAVVGAGGAGGSKESRGNAGNATAVYQPDGSALASAPGADRPDSGYGSAGGQSPGSRTYGNYTYFGGSGGSQPSTLTPNHGGTGAGGGGGGGGFFGTAGPGGNGGDGAVWIRCYTAYEVEVLGN